MFYIFIFLYIFIFIFYILYFYFVFLDILPHTLHGNFFPFEWWGGREEMRLGEVMEVEIFEVFVRLGNRMKL